eukprot:TRINITY_DN4359_c0_g2_i1.p1 TRINITY_DN4359_c0_g2~~TRINITY_DN4359_c0_g2_i1.p1  ORF type:complete len:2005 (+),score=603.41 TRINITY_DN4359_c0_g2_i1:55-6069(+)
MSGRPWAAQTMNKPGQPARTPGAPARPAAAAPGSRPSSPAGARPVVQPSSRPSSAPAGSSSGSTASLPKITVSTQIKSDDIGIQTLLGDYADKGANHGKRFYQKIQKISGHEDTKVFLYYWDNRDGADFSGWWFGDQVGGTEVWARCVNQGVLPPKTGWKVPWDSPTAKPGLLLVDAYKASAGGSPASTPRSEKSAPGPASPASSPTGGSATPQVIAAKVKRATAQVESAEKAANLAANKAKTTLSAATPATEAVLKDLLASLAKQQTALTDAQKNLTQDIAEVRKGGVSTTTFVTQLSQLSPKIRAAQAAVSEQLQKIKTQIAKPSPAQTAAQKEAEKKQEEKDTKEFDAALPPVKELASAAEESVENLASLADPIVASPPAEESEELKGALDEIEAAFQESQNKIAEARKLITEKLQSARSYAPETRKKALAEYSSLQTMLSDAQKKLMPFKTFKKDFKSKVAAKKALSELSEKFDSAELEVEKAGMMSLAADSSQMPEDEIVGTEKVVEPAQKEIANLIRTVDQKLQSAQSAVKDELVSIKDKGNQLKKKCDQIMAKMRSQRAGLSAQQLAAQCTEKVIAAEESLTLCQDAEMPFLKGIEVLPPDESEKAIADSEAAATKAEAALSAARTFIRTKQAEAKKFPKEMQEKADQELKQFVERAEACGKKISDFRKETNERKTAAIMAEVVEVISGAEKKVKAYADVAQVFLDDLETVTTESLTEAMEKVGDLEKEANAGLAEAKKQFSLKQKNTKGGAPAASLNKLQGRLTSCQTELGKFRKAALTGDKLIKGKETLADEIKNVELVEEEVAKVEKASIPLEAGGELSEEEMAAVGDTIVSAQNALKKTMRSLETHLTTPVASLKAAFQKLVDKCKASQEKMDKTFGGAKDQKEAVLSQAYLRDARKKTDLVDSIIDKVNEAELPFLKGIEVLPLEEATSTVEKSEAAAKELSSAITEARNYIAAQNLAMKNFSDKEKAKTLTEEFAALSQRVNNASTKLAAFKKDTESRKKNAQLQEAGEKIKVAEQEVEKATEAVAPLGGEEYDKLPSDEAAALSEKATAQTKAAQAAMDEAKALLAARQKDCKNVTGAAETLKKLQTRIGDAATSLHKAKKASSEQEHKFLGKRVIKEAAEIVASLDAEVKAAEEACAPLVEGGATEFLVSSSLKTVAAALREHMAKESKDIAALFKEAAGGEGSIAKEAFLAYLQKLPETIAHPEVEFTEERREALFKMVDATGEGSISEKAFRDMFKQTFICVTGISMTDVLQVSASKTTCKVEAKEVLEALGEVSKDEATGVERVEAKILSSGETGFVTVKGNQGTTYLEEVSPFNDFCAKIDKTLEERLANLKKASSELHTKINEIAAAGSSAPLTEAREELNKLRPEASAKVNAIQGFKAKVVAAKKEFKSKEAAEKNAHIERQERKEAEAITSEAITALEAAEALATKAVDVAEPMLSLKEEDVKNFATPASLLEEVEKLVPEAIEALNQAKSVAQEQHKKLAKASKGPMLDAKREVQKMVTKAESVSKKCNTTLQAVKKACASLVEVVTGKASTGLRDAVRQPDASIDKLFDELAAGSDKISEEAFCSRLLSLPGLDLQPEHAKLISRNIEVGGISKRSLLSFVQKYYVVSTGIAITTEFDVGKGKSIRKLEPEELIEVVEGPVIDDKTALARVKGKSLLDSTEGWITIKGNQGSVFLKEVEKPVYVVTSTEQVRLTPEAKAGTETVRSLKPGEVLEMLAGPQKETFEPSLKAKGKALSDSAVGWFDIRDKEGTIFAEAEGKFYTCTSSVAMTDNLDIKDCNVVKKLAVGELFAVEEGPVDEPGSGVSRVKGKSCEDDKVGWITIKGNAGTVYAKASVKHYAVVKEIPLRKEKTADAETVRQLVEGEVLNVLEGPKSETHQPVMRVKVKASSDGAIGWVSTGASIVKRWNGNYKCSAATPLQSACKADGAELLRELAASEVLELQDGPVAEGDEMRIKVKAKKDGLIGWATLIDSTGKRLFSF